MKSHIANRYQNNGKTFCGLRLTGGYWRTWWADAIKIVKSKPKNERPKQWCSTCMKMFKSKRIKQLTVEECKKA